MAEDSWPKSTRNSGTINDYEHEQLEAPAQPNGLIGVPTDATLVYADATGRQIKVRANRYGLLRAKTWYSGNVEFTKAIAANTSGSTRVDLVVLRWDRSTNAVTLEVRAGTPGAGRPAPVQQVPPATTFGTGIWELPIAQVTVVNNAASLAAGDVVNLAWYVGSGGEVLCTAATRPYGVVGLGQTIYETDTKKRWHWDATYWRPETGQCVLDITSAALNQTTLDNGRRSVWAYNWAPPCPGTYNIRTLTPFDGVANEEAKIYLNVFAVDQDFTMIAFAAGSQITQVPLSARINVPSTAVVAMGVDSVRTLGGSFFAARGAGRKLTIDYMGPEGIVAAG